MFGFGGFNKNNSDGLGIWVSSTSSGYYNTKAIFSSSKQLDKYPASACFKSVISELFRLLLTELLIELCSLNLLSEITSLLVLKP
jgi:hypothetical protein